MPYSASRGLMYSALDGASDRRDDDAPADD